jgi:hypothetical protein
MLCILWETAMTMGLRLRIRKQLVQSSDGRVVLRALVVLSLSFLIESWSLRAQNPTSILEEIEWTWEVRPQRADPKLPNVLLGDSITRNCFPQVNEDLRGVADVYLMASSTSVGDPRLSHQIAEFAVTQRISFAVVHFNNGMHDWGYTDHNSSLNFPSSFEPFGPFRVAASSYGPPSLQSSQRQPAAPPIPTSTRGVPSAQAFMEAEKIPVDDQHALLTQHPDLYEDGVHFNKVGSAIMGGHAATIIKRVLETPGREGHGQD